MDSKQNEYLWYIKKNIGKKMDFLEGFLLFQFYNRTIFKCNLKIIYIILLGGKLKNYTLAIFGHHKISFYRILCNVLLCAISDTFLFPEKKKFKLKNNKFLWCDTKKGNILKQNLKQKDAIFWIKVVLMEMKKT